MNNLTIITLDQVDIVDFAGARNAELSKAKTPWVFFVDKDEKITPALKAEILQAVSSKPYAFDAYYVPRLDTFLGQELTHGETGRAKFIRLAKKDFGSWQRPVHEVWQGKGKIGSLKNPLLHAPHASISTFLEKINRYSTIEAQYRYEQGIKSSLAKIFFYPIVKFKWNYLFKLGILDGVPGTILAMMMSFHSYLTWTKLYLLWQTNLPRTKL
ncbi:MAG: glycosyltransferase family 2 protein [bacterium]